MGTIRLLNAALDEYDGRMVLRGALDMECLDALLTDEYQREVQPASSLAKIMKGYEAGSAVPDIELGMRGARKAFREGVYTLHDPVYIIDGLQRVSAAKLFKQRSGIPHLGACVHFNTTMDWERERFRILNAERTRVSANVMLRNDRHKSEALAALYKLTTDHPGFILHNRVSWGQRMGRGEIFNAMVVAKAVSVLHSYKTRVMGANFPPSEGYKILQGVGDYFGLPTMKANVKHFFETLDTCYSYKLVKYAEKNPSIKAPFLITIARVFANHEIFWRGDKLMIETSLQRKLSQFGINDPMVAQMATNGGSKVAQGLYQMIVDHLNSGKRTRRLVARVPLAQLDLSGGAEEDDAGEGDSEQAAAS